MAYALRALKEAESRYAQVEKELLVATFTSKKFHDFIYGRETIIETDHKPITAIVNKPLQTAPARLQRTLLQLQRYNLKFIYRRGTELHVADALSRDYITEEPDVENDDQLDVLSFSSISPLRTLADPIMQKVAHFIANGWPSKLKSVIPDVKVYFRIRDELIVDNGVILKGLRVVVPNSLPKEYIQRLHKGHPGTDATKRRAKDMLYWPSVKL